MRIVMAKDHSRVMCKDYSIFRSIKKHAPKSFELKQHLNDGGYWTHSHAVDLATINGWLRDNYKVELSYYDGK